LLSTWVKNLLEVRLLSSHFNRGTRLMPDCYGDINPENSLVGE
jgi:hypothetical protein